MTDYTDYKFTILDGMPSDGERAIFLGFDQNYKPCLLKWSDKVEGGWMGLTFGPPPDLPAAFIPNKEGAQQVTRFAFLPAVHPWKE